MAFSHRLHVWQLSSMAGARWLRQRSNARKCEFAMKALTVWRAVPPCCHAVLAQSMRVQHASNTAARANYHTHLPSCKRPAITFGRTSGWRRRRWNQSSEGRVGRVFKLGERSPLMCPPWGDHTERGHQPGVATR